MNLKLKAEREHLLALIRQDRLFGQQELAKVVGQSEAKLTAQIDSLRQTLF